MNLNFTGKIWYWKGPAPWYFVTVPADECEVLHSISRQVTYGWGMIPVSVQINETSWETALFPKDGKYLVPIKSDVRKAEGIAEGDEVSISIEVG